MLPDFYIYDSLFFFFFFIKLNHLNLDLGTIKAKL